MTKSSYKKIFFIIMPTFPYLPNKLFFSLKDVIYKNFINIKFSIYNGKNNSSILFNQYMVGFKIGSFVFTRKKAIFKKKQKNKNKK